MSTRRAVRVRKFLSLTDTLSGVDAREPETAAGRAPESARFRVVPPGSGRVGRAVRGAAGVRSDIRREVLGRLGDGFDGACEAADSTAMVRFARLLLSALSEDDPGEVTPADARDIVDAEYERICSAQLRDGQDPV